MNKLRNFMIGRYGYDDLNQCILGIYVLNNLIYIFSRKTIFLILDYVFLVLFIYRTFSKNIAKRQSENYLFLDKTKGIRKRFKVIKNNMTDKSYRYYLCPNCKQLVRVPRGHGKVEIHCPKCGKDFKRKS